MESTVVSNGTLEIGTRKSFASPISDVSDWTSRLTRAHNKLCRTNPLPLTYKHMEELVSAAETGYATLLAFYEQKDIHSIMEPRGGWQWKDLITKKASSVSPNVAITNPQDAQYLLFKTLMDETVPKLEGLRSGKIQLQEIDPVTPFDRQLKARLDAVLKVILTPGEEKGKEGTVL